MYFRIRGLEREKNTITGERIMKHSHLKNKSNKTYTQSYKKRNLITKLNMQPQKNILMTFKIQLTLTTPETNVSHIFQTSTIIVTLKFC